MCNIKFFGHRYQELGKELEDFFIEKNSSRLKGTKGEYWKPWKNKKGYVEWNGLRWMI